MLVEGQADFLRLYGVICRLFIALKRSESPTDAQDGEDTYSAERANASSTEPFEIGEVQVLIINGCCFGSQGVVKKVVFHI